jgi:hypothetical protein
MIEEPDLYDEVDILCSIIEKFVLTEAEYKSIFSVHNSLVGHHGFEKTKCGPIYDKRLKDSFLYAHAVRSCLN